MSTRSVDIAEGYFQACSETDLNATDIQAISIVIATGDPHYGFVMEDNLEAVTGLINEGSTHLPIEAAPAAMGTLAVLLTASGQRYRNDSELELPTQEVWDRHVQGVRQGQINLLPRKSWMSRLDGQRQVKLADKYLSDADPGVEQILAALNYGLYFRPKTMAGAARTLAESPEIAATSEEIEGMPHLSVTNWTIGQVVQHIYEQMSSTPEGTLHIMDMCSGTGATLAAITNRLTLANVKGTGLEQDRLSMLGFEATPAFIEQLRSDFLPEAEAQLRFLGIARAMVESAAIFETQSRPGVLTIVEGDVVKAVKDLDLAEVGKDDVVVATANYGLHRIPSKQKAEMITQLATVENSIIVVGDLRQNGSKVNRGYFNLTNNGPLNAGNINLGAILSQSGYSVLTRDYYRFVDAVLLNRLDEESINDGFVTVAVKGQKAFELIFS